jgi:hypothetical protein
MNEHDLVWFEAWVNASSPEQIAAEFYNLREKLKQASKEVFISKEESKSAKEARDIWCYLAKKWLVESGKEIKALNDQIKETNNKTEDINNTLANSVEELFQKEVGTTRDNDGSEINAKFLCKSRLLFDCSRKSFIVF